jgi:OOP family OmpA-OmpF porin
MAGSGADATMTSDASKPRYFRLRRLMALPFALALSLAAGAVAAQDVFSGGWTLNADSSTLGFQSVKNETIVEASTFATYAGAIAEDGTATIEVQLDSVDTKVDLRNVRMRFLFFETFSFPVAKITARLDPAQLADLPELRRKVLTIPFTLDLHGMTKEMTAQVAVVMITPDLVAVSTIAPVSVAVADFDLTAGLAKLEDAAKVRIIPSGSVTFDLLFARNAAGDAGTAAPGPVAETADTPPAPEPAPSGAAAALETQGDFSLEECAGRFEILSRSQSINFRTASAMIEASSNAFLDALADIVTRCPGMVVEVGGHTDSIGGDAANLALSERRAAQVADYLVGKGIERGRLVAKGYGEAAPVASNDTAEGRAKNRRIEFRIAG